MPVKRGFNVWVRADGVNGCVCEFEVYTGKTDGEMELGLGGNVVKRLTRNIITLSVVTTSSQAPLSFAICFKIRYTDVVHIMQHVNAILLI